MAQLKDGDQIKIGDTVLKFVANPLIALCDALDATGDFFF